MNQLQFARHLRKDMTEAEQLLCRHLRAHRLCGEKFRRQQPIGPDIVDFVHFGARVIIEADGGQHNGNTDDALRDAWLQGRGLTVLRFWNHEILVDVHAVLEVVLMALGKDAAPLPRPLSLQGEGSFTRFH